MDLAMLQRSTRYAGRTVLVFGLIALVWHIGRLASNTFWVAQADPKDGMLAGSPELPAADLFDLSPRGSWTFHNMRWQIAFGRHDSGDLAQWLEGIAEVTAPPPEEQANDGGLVDLLRRRATGERNLSDGRTVLMFDGSCHQARVLIDTGSDGHRVLSARAAIIRGQGQWLGVSALPTAPGPPGTVPETALLPVGSNTERIASRQSPSGEPMCELVRVQGSADQWLTRIGARQNTNWDGASSRPDSTWWYSLPNRLVMVRSLFDAERQETLCLAIVWGQREQTESSSDLLIGEGV